MKLRRALATAAATAAIAPLALLSAPAAFATGDANSAPSASSGETPPGVTPAPGDTTKPGAPEPGDQPPAPGDTTKPGDDNKPGDDTKPGDDNRPGDDTKPADGKKPGGDTKPKDDAKPGGDTKPGGDAKPGDKGTGPREGGKPTAEPTECPSDPKTGEDAESKLELRLTGLPGKITAGGGWHEFKLTAANPSDEELGDVEWLVAADNFSESEKEKDWLSTYARIQFYDPEAKGWKSIVDEVEDGVAFGRTTLSAKEQVEIKLRLNINAKAPAGDSYALGLGGYVDSELNCRHNAFTLFEFTVLKAGSDNEDPGEATPVPDATEPPHVRPQGIVVKPVKSAKTVKTVKKTTVTDIAPTGSLAQTGSNSMLPTIGVVGGIAVVAGAGAVFAVRRRAHSDSAA
ncbi:hypothetical protein [Streptomyces aureocirculatus]|uniref:hypothetical protein n=1 Tax=Streptomyces aureocirculatus TaxID=67275 RepID=UPI0004C70740|nr:hypothetical protein [Streptomyces aureocirculatus]